MPRREKKRATLEEILASTSDALFPADLGKRAVSLSSQDCDGDTPLHVMVWRKDAYAVKVLVDAGANIDAPGDMGETPLHIAVSQKCPEVIQILLDAGAKTNIRSEFNVTAAERAAKEGREILKLFRKNS